MNTNTPIQNTPYEAQGYEIKLTAERIEALLKALDTADAAENITEKTLEELTAIITVIKDWDSSDDSLDVKDQLINIYNNMISSDEVDSVIDGDDTNGTNASHVPSTKAVIDILVEIVEYLMSNIPIEPGAGENTIQIKNLNGAAIADNAISMGEGCVAGSKAFYVASIGNNTYTLDSVEGLEVGDVCSAMFLDIMNDAGRVDRVYQDFGTISAINTSTNTITFDVAAPTSSDPTVFVGFMCVLDKPNIGTQMTGIASFSGGYGCITLGDRSRAYGSGCIAVGKNAVAEGDHTKALNKNARAVGSYTEALGVSSYAEGNHTKALAGNTHAGGNYTTAASTNQRAYGRYNIIDNKNKYADIVGNGTDEEHRSNAYTLDWDGNGWFAGDVTVGKDNKKLAKEKVWETISTITVEPDENGELTHSIIFTKDSDGNDFELTDFYLETFCTTISEDNYAQENYEFCPTIAKVAVNGDTICDYEHISYDENFSKWYLRYVTFGENGGGLFIKPSQCIFENYDFEGDFENIKLSIVATNNFLPITYVTVDSQGFPFMETSTFVLKGVRK